MDFVERSRPTRARKPVWLFSSGPLDPAELSLGEHALRRTPRGRATLHAGDSRDGDEIRAWAGEVGEALGHRTPA